MKLFALFVLALICSTYVINASITLESIEEVTADFCPECVSFMDESLQTILNIILNGGVIGGCDELCSLLNQSEVITTLCNLACDAVGIKVFIYLIQKADLDSIWMCEECKLCPVKDGNATIISTDVQPKSGPAGTTFQLTMIYQVTEETGTGTVEVDVQPIDGMPLGDAELIIKQGVGSYKITWSIQTEASDDDPWGPGKAEVDFFVCDGECGSKHAHSKIYSTATNYFTITE
eukprot:Anaeramoba_ignava/a608694_3762.p1 GENE.a608694_3762~~a608694_3762.p1  ORF type:complete len:247 (+),score=70.75 a608694_3762:42-743(+)